MSAKTKMEIPRPIAIDYLVNKGIEVRKKDLYFQFSIVPNEGLSVAMNEFADPYTEYVVVDKK